MLAAAFRRGQREWRSIALRRKQWERQISVFKAAEWPLQDEYMKDTTEGNLLVYIPIGNIAILKNETGSTLSCHRFMILHYHLPSINQHDPATDREEELKINITHKLLSILITGRLRN